MKKTLLTIASALCSVAFFFSCSDLTNLSTPKKVVVKPGDARYSFPFGNATFALEEYINIDKLTENLTVGDDDSAQLHVYDYQGQRDPTLQQYIIEYPITKISLNSDDYLSDVTDFLQNLDSGVEGGGAISIPIADAFNAVANGLSSSSIRVNIPLGNLNKTIKNLGNGNRTITGLSIPAITESIPETAIDFNCNGYLKSAIIERGNFTIACELPTGWSGVTADVTISVSGAIDGVGLQDASKKRGFLFNKEADLSGKTINGKAAKLKVNGSITLRFNNATIALNNDGSIPDLTLACGATIEKIRDVKIYLEKVLDKATLSIEKPIPVTIPEYVVNCKVVKLNMQAAIDTNLSNIIANLYIQPRILSNNMGFDASSNTEYSSVFDSGGGLRIMQDVDDGWSGFFIVNKSASTRMTEMDFKVDFDMRGDGHDPKNPGAYDRANDTITVTELDLTKTSSTDYYIKPTFGAPDDGHIFECDDLILEIDESIIPHKPIETGLSIGEIFDDFVEAADNDTTKEQIRALVDAIELMNINAYLYVTAPETSDVNFQTILPNITGYVKATYKDERGIDRQEWLIGDENKVKLELKNNLPSFASIAQNGLITTDSHFGNGYYSAKTQGNTLCDIVNARANDLAFDYDISLGISDKKTITLSRAQINALQDAATQVTSDSAKAEISISIAVVLPLQLRITEDVPVDIMAFANNDVGDNDLLGGEGSDTDYSDYADIVDYIELTYYLKNPIGLRLKATLSEANNVIGKKEMEFKNAEQKLRLSSDEASTILTKNSFIPNINATLEKTTISIKRNTEIKMGAALVIATNSDGGIEFDL